MVIIALANQKGGVGKSTIANIMSHRLASIGYRTLLIDLDPQASITKANDVKYNPGQSIANMFQDMMENQEDEAISIKPYITNLKENLDIIYGGTRLANINWSAAYSDINQYLYDGLESVMDDYDLCIVDTPGADGEYLSMALAAADYVVIPVIPSKLDIQATPITLMRINQIQKQINEDLTIAGILINNAESTSNDRVIIDQIRELYKDHRVFKHTIRHTTLIRATQLTNKDIFSQNSKVRNDLDGFLKELLKFIIDDQA